MKIKLVILAIILVISSSCNKYLDMQNPSSIDAETFYNTEQDAFEATMAMYSNIQHLNYYGADYFKLTEYPSDDITTKLAVSALDNFSWSAVRGAADTDVLERFYKHLFEGIYRTNLVLEKVAVNRVDKKEKIPFKDEKDRNSILAEAYFLRGLHYFNAGCMFGGIPIITETPKEADLGGILYTKRSTRQQTFEQAIGDLKKSIGEGSDVNIKLPTEWSESFKGRATMDAGYALLGKIYLHAACYLQNPEYFNLAATYLKKVIDSNKGYSLLPKYKDVFSAANKHNKESIFEIGYGLIGENGFFHDGGNAGENTQRDLLFGVQKGAQGFGELIATLNWVYECEYGDPRAREFVHFTWDTLNVPDENGKPKTIIYSSSQAETVKEVGINAPGSYFHVKKAVDGFQAGGPGGLFGINNWRLIRFADVLLMYAEALNESGKGAEAITYINKIRDRARNNAPRLNGVRVFRDVQIIRTARSNAKVGEWTGLFSETTITGTKHKVNSAMGLEIMADYPAMFGTNNFGFVDLSGTSKENVREMIVRERRTELAFEYLRFLDMRRWEALDPGHFGAAEKVFRSKSSDNSLAGLGGNDNQPYNKSIHKLYPIPQIQIDLSQGTLVQNPGY